MKQKLLTRSGNYRDYQYALEDFILNRTGVVDTNHCAGWAGMGTGKTAVGLHVAQTLLESCECSKVLIVSTKMAATNTWQYEHQKWDTLLDLRPRLITGDLPAERRIEVLKQGDIHIVNQEMLPWLVKLYGRYWPYDAVFLDDTKGFKRPRAKNFMAVRSVRPAIRRLVYLNGTPAPNGYLQLWPQIFLLDYGKRLGKTLTQYQRRWFYPKPNGFGFEPRDETIYDEINERIQDLALSVNASDFLDLPDRFDHVVTVPLTDSLRSQYKELERDFFLELDDGEEVLAGSSGVLGNKLRQFCNGAIYTDPLDKSKVSLIHDLKLTALRDLIEELNGERVIVAYEYKHDYDRIKHLLGKRVVHLKDDNAVSRWNAGEIEVLCTHPGSGGHGLNLQWGGRTIIWFGAQWNLELNQQMDERIGQVRQAQSGLNNNPVYYRLAIEDSIEQVVAEGLAEKEATQQRLRDAVSLYRREERV